MSRRIITSFHGVTENAEVKNAGADRRVENSGVSPMDSQPEN